MAITTTSVSFALIIKALLLSIATCRTCTKYVSLPLRAHMLLNLLTQLYYCNRRLPLSQWTSRARLLQTTGPQENGKGHSCCTLLSLRKLFQFSGVSLVAVTLLRIPLPLWDSASSFRLNSLYTSNIISTLYYLVEHDLTLGRTSSLA